MPVSTEALIPSLCRVPPAPQWQDHKRRASTKFEPEKARRPPPLFLASSNIVGGEVSPDSNPLRSPVIHKPTLKGVGKSDCEVRIISIAESVSEVAWESLDYRSNGIFFDVYDMA